MGIIIIIVSNTKNVENLGNHLFEGINSQLGLFKEYNIYIYI